jgi:hypothetical protein
MALKIPSWKISDDKKHELYDHFAQAAHLASCWIAEIRGPLVDGLKTIYYAIKTRYFDICSVTYSSYFLHKILMKQHETARAGNVPS